VTEAELELRRRIMVAFAETGEPPGVSGEDPAVLGALERAHVIVRDSAGRIVMAHPFAAHDDGTTVTAGGRTWRGSCAWDAFGIAAALGLPDYDVADVGGVRATDDALFHVAVPAARWWDDIAFT